MAVAGRRRRDGRQIAGTRILLLKEIWRLPIDR